MITVDEGSEGWVALSALAALFLVVNRQTTTFPTAYVFYSRIPAETRKRALLVLVS